MLEDSMTKLHEVLHDVHELDMEILAEVKNNHDTTRWTQLQWTSRLYNRLLQSTLLLTALYFDKEELYSHTQSTFIENKWWDIGGDK